MRLAVEIMAALIPLMFVVIGGLVCGRLEGWSDIDALYWAFITVFTVGYGDLSPASQEGRFVLLVPAPTKQLARTNFCMPHWYASLFAFFYIPLGISIFIKTVGAIVALVFNHQFKQVPNHRLPSPSLSLMWVPNTVTVGGKYCRPS